MPTPQLTSVNQAADREKEDVCLFAQTDFRNQMRRFGIKLDDRRRHMYVIGKTGMGKTTMMENMVMHDIYAGHGVGIVDPHGDFAERMIDYIPPRRINDVIYFNPADTDYPIGFNILEVKNEEQKHLVAAGLMGVFKKIWPDVWSARMEYILNNTLLALLDYPGSTLLGINRLLADKRYRRKVVNKLKDPVIKAFWQNEFASYNERYAQEAVAPIQNKIGQFLSANVIRNMVAQVTSTIDVRQIMDNRKIFVINLSKGRIGEDNSRLLGGMLITKIQLAAMERVDTPEEQRQDFFLYVDEFQNFATASFANILSEARKYRLSLIMAHQYIKQLDELVADAVFGNVGTIVSFRVGGPDSEELVREFTPTFLEEDIVNLAKYHVFLKLMIDGVASQPFSAMTMPPIGSPTGSAEKIIKVSRERYAKSRADIEDKITRWSGMEIAADDDGDEENEFEVETRREIKPIPPGDRQPPPPALPTTTAQVRSEPRREPNRSRPSSFTKRPDGFRPGVGELVQSRPKEPLARNVESPKTLSLNELLPRDKSPATQPPIENQEKTNDAVVQKGTASVWPSPAAIINKDSLSQKRRRRRRQKARMLMDEAGSAPDRSRTELKPGLAAAPSDKKYQTRPPGPAPKSPTVTPPAAPKKLVPDQPIRFEG